jgi:oxygen-independent coproporphyrinogen-3 oxidase
VKALASGGIYIHFPYCGHRCNYCDFNVATPKNPPQGRYTEAIIAELAWRGQSHPGPYKSLYIGGGTPSLWRPSLLRLVLEAARQVPGLAPDAEVTLEANPNEVTAEFLDQYLETGINRISLGVQSLRNEHLHTLDRRHRAKEVEGAIVALNQAGLSSYSIDMIFGVSGQTVHGWKEDLNRLVSWDVPHLSLYGLTLEERTQLAWLVRRGEAEGPCDIQQAELMFAARSLLSEAGYLHYEVSSYAQSGHRAVHNSMYWNMEPYLGIGAGAHGFLAPQRWKNIARPSRYIDAALRGDPTEHEEILDSGTLSYEKVMTGLRDLERGVKLTEELSSYRGAFQQQVEQGYLWAEEDRFKMTEQGLRFMDDLLLALMPS